MRSAVAFLAFVVYVQAISYADVLESEWNTFRTEYGRQYETQEEEQLRRQIFEDNKQMIDKHNRRYMAGEETYELGVNQFTDMLPKEFVSQMLLNLNTTSANSFVDFVYTQSDDIEIPSSIDWRALGGVTSVKDQGKCFSCWALSAAGSLEGQYFAKTRKLVELSAQNLLDCSSQYPFVNKGCIGGSTIESFRYVILNGGIDTEKSYPYEGRLRTCRFNKSYVGATVRAISQVRKNQEYDLAYVVATKGPVSVDIDASKLAFYSSGVYNNPNCTNPVNHAAVVVGYGHDSLGGDYWLVKNSWGPKWGESGYVRMSRNRNNQCGIASNAILPLV